ncbi:hypothetical protein VKT23_015330 [Stygiomarasmius scandens]|uniref:Uncharacterized protein n=1 Tax=Marasmiellus scandens TaxID=2682957 RepID=A0ABR1J2J2_9AGAR
MCVPEQSAATGETYILPLEYVSILSGLIRVVEIEVGRPVGVRPHPLLMMLRCTINVRSQQNPSNCESTPSSVKDTGVLSLHNDHPEAPSSAVAFNIPESSSAATGIRRSLRHSASSAALADQEFDDLIDSLNSDHDKASSIRAKFTKSASTKSPKKKPAVKATANSPCWTTALLMLRHTKTSACLSPLLEELHTSVSLMHDSYDYDICFSPT